MPDRLSLHAPLLVNTLGHFAGAIVFGLLFYLLLLDARRDLAEKRILPMIAASLAFLWNLGSLIGLATGAGEGSASDVIVALSFSILSFLPAVLLHISTRQRILYLTGYATSGIATALHLADLVTGAPRLHHAAIFVITIGFAVLTAISVVLETTRGRGGGASKRLATAMVLFIFAISFAHFRSEHASGDWSGEAALHHAGIPLALFILLQDYRFLFLDVFLRFLGNAVLAAAAVGAAVYAESRLGPFSRLADDPFRAGIVFATACLLLTAFAILRNRFQHLLTRVVFLRSNPERIVAQVRDLGETAVDEQEFLESVTRRIAVFIAADRSQLIPAPAADIVRAPEAVLDTARRGVPGWVQAIVPISFSRGDGQWLLLGRRRGGRRYLSEDLEVMAKLAASAARQIERMRLVEMQSLVTRAELQALQAQINPHFFFNALNTLYGTISRDNTAARRLILNLADLFRYSLNTERTFVRIEDELKLVRAYLEIEELRLGPKLRTELLIDEAALPAEIPALSVQPLVENAVKHGAAAQPEGGFVRLSIRVTENAIRIAVVNSGAFVGGTVEKNGAGVGLNNVRRRLELCYGKESALEIQRELEATHVSFRVPLPNGAFEPRHSLRPLKAR